MAHRPELNLSARPELKTRLGIRFSSVLQMSEDEVSKLIALLESDYLFQKLHRAEDRDWKIFSRERFPSTKYTPSFYEFDETLSVQPAASPDVQTVLLTHKKLFKEIEKIGQENFESYFLYDEGEKSAAEIATELGIPESTVKEIRTLTDQILMQSQSQTSPVQPAQANELGLRYSKIAAYARKPNGEFEIDFMSPNMGRGLYKINYERLKKLKQSGALNSQEKKSVQELIEWLELINGRKNLIFKILKWLPVYQKDFFSSGDWDQLVPLTQKIVAKALNVTPAAVCRAIQNRSIDTVQGEEAPLVDFFPSTKDMAKRKLAPLFKENPNLSDEKMKTLIQKTFGIALSRRSVNIYRREIGKAR